MRKLIAVTLLALAACSRTPSSPSTPAAPPPVPVALADFSGLWAGAFRLTSCTGERHCFILIGTQRPFTMRLRQTGAQVRGLFTASGYTADVSGAVLKDGSVELTGSGPAASAQDGSIRVPGVSLRLTPDRELAGTIGYETTPNPYGAEFALPASAAGDIVSATRTDLQIFAATVDGLWRGRSVIRSCVPTGTYCYPNQKDEVVEVQLSLGRSGDAVSGTFRSGSLSVPVVGRIAGTSITLSGESSSASSGGSSSMRLTSWTGSIDEFGRMTGTFQYEYRYPAAAPTLGESASAELWQVLKVP
jgi:hypothetical protein